MNIEKKNKQVIVGDLSYKYYYQLHINNYNDYAYLMSIDCLPR